MLLLGLDGMGDVIAKRQSNHSRGDYTLGRMVSSPYQHRPKPCSLRVDSKFGTVSPLAGLSFAGTGKAQGQLSDELEIHLARRSHFSSTQPLSELLGECIGLQSVERRWGLVLLFLCRIIIGLGMPDSRGHVLQRYA